MFIDRARIVIAGGAGGDGVVSFRREKYVPRGGPDGGRGGDGGSVIFEVNPHLRTLIDLQYNRHYRAENGRNGEGGNRNGKDGKDIIIPVPPGTVIIDAETDEVLADLIVPGQKLIAARGGKGGRGNSSFTTSVKKAPMVAENGMPGDERQIVLELKLLADVGLVGFPNVGKSTLLAVVSAARPKIANYPFTTLKPGLGTVYVGTGESFVLADIPGLIEGAAEGLGLGLDFLRHIERTKIAIHVLDVAGLEGRDPREDYEVINRELAAYSPKLATLPQVIALNKFDLINDEDLVADYVRYFEGLGHKVFLISAVTGYNTKELMRYVHGQLTELSEEVEPADVQMIIEAAPTTEKNYSVTFADGIYLVSGELAERLINITDFANREALQRFQGLLKKHGILQELERLGIEEGDTINFAGMLFEYFPDVR